MIYVKIFFILINLVNLNQSTYVSPILSNFKIIPKSVANFDRQNVTKNRPKIAYWPDNKIPYSFHSSCKRKCRNLLIEAIKEWQEDTCVRFLSWGSSNNITEAQEALNYVIFRADQPGCFTVERDVGAGGGGQSVNLGEGCFLRNKILHEIGHVLDLEHVHTRFDRDEYIVINRENVVKDMEDQYTIRKRKNELVPYDYRSIMHYQSSDFSVDPFVKLTMSTKSPILQYLIDEPRKRLSFYDKKLVIFCFNQGIPIRRKGKCTCLCPPLTSGNNCKFKQTRTNHHPLLLRSGKSECGGLLKKEGKISTPNYPIRLTAYQSCGWVINAPERHRIELIFDDFEIANVSRDVNNYPGKCVDERVEIRCRDIYKAEIYCGGQLNATRIVSKNNFLIINLIADGLLRGRGFTAHFKFIK